MAEKHCPTCTCFDVAQPSNVIAINNLHDPISGSEILIALCQDGSVFKGTMVTMDQLHFHWEKMLPINENCACGVDNPLAEK